MHTTANLPGYPWIWRRAGDNPAPLDADVRKTTARPTAGTPRQDTAFGTPGGTMHGLTPKADRLLAAGHGGVYSKAVPQ